MRRAAVVSLFLCLGALCAAPALARQGSRFRPGVSGTRGVIATESPAAARVGRAVLERGGNAIDAAAATVFAMGVARPQSCGIGGGGFMVYRSHHGRARALDFREIAPAAMNPTSLSGPGLHKTFTGHLTVGIPGVVAGMDAALARYGTLTLRQVIAPAESLARNGVRVTNAVSSAMSGNASRLGLFPVAAAQYLRPDGTAYPPHSLLRQPELAASLRRIMRGGPAAFYRGTIARRIVRDMQAPRPATQDPGLLTLADFAAYHAKWRNPLFGSYRGAGIVAMPPPTSGGIALLEILNVLEGFDLRSAGQSSTQAIHLITEAEKIALADRARYVADPDFVSVPTGTLTSKAYAATRRSEIDPTHAGTYNAGAITPPGASTTHISVIDARGNAVALTCTIEQEFGSAVVAPGTGFLLNNELTDFGAPGTANEPRPGKRPRSSMSPTIVVRDHKPVLVVGAAGGATIIMGPLLAVVDTIDFGLDIPHALDAERFDAISGQLAMEDARVDPAVLAQLESMGYTLQRQGEYATRPRMQAAGIDLSSGLRVAASDPRSEPGALAQRRRGTG